MLKEECGRTENDEPALQLLSLNDLFRRKQLTRFMNWVQRESSACKAGEDNDLRYRWQDLADLGDEGKLESAVPRKRRK